MTYIKWKEAIKSVVLVLLIVSMVLIYGLNWVYRLDREDLMRGKTWVTGFAHFFGIIQNVDQTALSVEVTPAAYPMKIAARTEKGLYSVQYDQEAVMSLYQKIIPVFTRALESVQETSLTDETEYKKALQSQMVYFGFDGEIPFYAFSEWINVANRKEYDFIARHIVFADDSGTLSIFVNDGNDAQIHKIKTQTSSAQFIETIGALAPNNSFFAFEGGKDYSSIEPETILLSSYPSIVRLIGNPPSFVNNKETAQTLLEAFGYNPYTVRSYEENDGTLVYVENSSTLRIDPDGTVHFLVSDAQGGIPISGILSGENSPTAVVRMIEAARFLVDRASANVRGDAAPYFRGYQLDSETQTYTALFDMEVSGVSVFNKAGPAAQIEIKDGMIYAATLRLRSYQKTSASSYLMPQKQAVSMYSPKAEMNGALWVRYGDLFETNIAATFYIS